MPARSKDEEPTESLNLANLVLYIHFAFVLGVVVPLPLILVGGIRGWLWVRNSWFRNLHLLMIGIVVLETLIGMTCPLTEWEARLRNGSFQAGQQVEAFVPYWIDKILFHDFPPWVFTCAYLVLGGSIALLYWKYPPRWISSRRKHSAGDPRHRVPQ